MAATDTAPECLVVPVKEESTLLMERATSKLNRLLIPFVLLFSIIASLDRANLSFASIDMTADLGYSPETYGLGAGIFFLTYSLFQVPCNVVYLYLGGPLMLGLIAICWGIIAASMAVVTSKTSFLVVRALLGVAEAGTVPGIWAYLSTMYPSSHLTVPTTFYMAGITAAQALGAPLAAAILSMHGAAGISGWRWLFIIEGAPAVLLGFFIWMFLPRDISSCRFLNSDEKQAIQTAIDSSSSVKNLSSRSLPTVVANCEAPGARSASSRYMTSRRNSPTAKQVVVDISAALKSRVVWCASGWRFLYLLALNGLIYWVPLIVYAMMGVHTPAATAAHAAPAIMLLTAVPYVAGVMAHICNAYHSKYMGEKRWHIALPWLWGGAAMCCLPVAWMHSGSWRFGEQATFLLLVVACMGVMGCDGVDVSWIISLLGGKLTSNQRVLAMACINTLANVGGFVGPYLNGELKSITGKYYAGVWVMGGVVVLAAACVAVFPLKWATGAQEQAESEGIEARIVSKSTASQQKQTTGQAGSNTSS